MGGGMKKIPKDIKGNPIFSKIWNNVYKRNMNQIIIVVGLPRTGKSITSEYCAYQLDRDGEGKHLFNPKTNVAGTFEALLELTESRNRRGEVFIWEEAGTIMGANSRRFYTDANILASSLFQILGWKGQIVIVNLPINFMLDKQVRSLVHAMIITSRVDINKKRCIAKFKWMSIDPERNKAYGKFPRYYRDGKLVKAKTISIPLPPKYIVDAYEEIEGKFKQKWVTDFRRQLKESQEIRDGRLGTRVDLSELLNEAKSNPQIYWDYEKDRPDISAMRMKLGERGISRHNALAVAGQWRKEVDAGICKK